MPVILYEKQRQILDFLVQYIQRNGSAPILKEIAHAMNLKSLATVHEHLKQLSRKGVIKITGQGKRRKFIIVDKKMADINRGMRLPILGYFSEGKEIEAYFKTDAFFAISPSLTAGKKRCFILEVKDDALEDEGIFSGDLLILEEESKIKDGETVIVILEGNIAILRKFFQESTRIRLNPIRTKKTPLYINKAKIQGKLLAVMRRF